MLLSIRTGPPTFTFLVISITVAVCFSLNFSTTWSILDQTRRVDRDSLGRTHAVTRDNLNSLTSQLMRAMHSAASETVLNLARDVENTVLRYQKFTELSLGVSVDDDIEGRNMSVAFSDQFHVVLRSMMSEDIRRSHPTLLSLVFSNGYASVVMEAPWVDYVSPTETRTPTEHIEAWSPGPYSRYDIPVHLNETHQTVFCVLGNGALCNTTYQKEVVIIENDTMLHYTLTGFPMVLQNSVMDTWLRGYGILHNRSAFMADPATYLAQSGNETGQWRLTLSGTDDFIVSSFVLPVRASALDDSVYGLVGAGMDLMAISASLRALPQSVNQRVFLTQPMVFDGEVSINLLGTSHGTAVATEITMSDGTALRRQRPRQVIDSDDYIIRESGLYVQRSHNNDFTALMDNTTYFFTASRKDKYFLRAGSLRTDTGIDVSVVVVVPWDEILGGVEENTRQVQLDVEDNDSSIDQYNLRMQAISIVIVTCICLSILISYIIAVRFFTMPLIALRADMARVAMMDFDALPRRKPAIISEVRSMQHSFDLMVEYLREFRAFVPQAVLAPREEVNAGVVVDPTFESIVSAAAGKGDTTNTTNARYDVVLPVSPEGSQRGGPAGSSEPTPLGAAAANVDFVPDDPRAARLRGTTMQPFNASFVAVRFAFLESDNGQNNVSSYNSNVLGQHPPGVRVGACGSKDVDRAHALHQAFVERCLRIVERNEGVVVRFEASLLVASWNAFRPCHQHEAMACHVAQELDKELCDFHIHVLVSSGHVLVGFLGSERVRSPVVLGDCMNDQDDLVRLCGVLSSRMLVTESVAHKVTTLFELCPVDVVRRDVSTTVYELLPRPPLPPSDRAGAASAHARHSDMYALYQRRHATFEAQATVYNMAF
eukprot:PhM_4_TR11618/c1_g1_i1/m.9562